MKHKNIVISGIGTEIGKTVCSAIVCEALQADYWKPIQAGELSHSDTMVLQKLVSNNNSKFHASEYNLKSAVSPHEAARRDNKKITISSLNLPQTNNQLIIEMAGGLMVPINDNELYIDYLSENNLPVILVSQYYLGSINHTLLSIESLKKRKIELLGIIFNGDKVQSTFDIIMKHAQTKCLLEVKHELEITPEIISNYARELANRI